MLGNTAQPTCNLVTLVLQLELGLPVTKEPTNHVADTHTRTHTTERLQNSTLTLETDPL